MSKPRLAAELLDMQYDRAIRDLAHVIVAWAFEDGLDDPDEIYEIEPERYVGLAHGDLSHEIQRLLARKSPKNERPSYADRCSKVDEE